MNTLLLKKFTPEILSGVRSLGLKPASPRGVLRLKEAEQLEEQTGKTVGELALLGIAAEAPAEQRREQRKLLRETLELMAAFNFRPVAEQTSGS